MTPDMQQAPAGYRPPRIQRRDGATAIRSGALTAKAAPAGHWGKVASPSPVPGRPRATQATGARATGPQSRAAARRAAADGSIVGVVPLLAVLVVAVAGLYISWRQGSAGGGYGGAICGGALLVAALVRLLLPARLAGLLANRKRVTDVITLTVFGAGLLVAGLVLPPQ